MEERSYGNFRLIGARGKEGYLEENDGESDR
jgi:hypothetical protein